MALTFVAGKRSYNQNNSTTVTTNETDGGTLNVAIGDLLLVWLKHEGATTTASIADTAGNTWHQGTWRHHTNGDLHGVFFWTQATNAHATDVVTVTLAAARSSKRVIVTQFRPTAGKVASQAAEYTNEGATGAPGTGAGTITWTTTEGVAIAGYSPYNPVSPTTATINGVSATLFPDPYAPYTQVWYRIVTAGFTGGAASAGMNDVWVSNLIAISFAAAATPLTVANTDQAQTTDAPVLGVGLTVANAAQAQATDAPTLTAHSGTTALTVANTDQAHTLDNVALTQHGILVLANLAQAQTVGASVLGVGLILANIAQAQATGAPVLGVGLVIASTAQAQTTDNVSPGVSVTLAIDAIWHTLSEDAPTLTYHAGLNIASTAQTQATGNVALTQHHTLSPANGAQAQAVNAVTLGVGLVSANADQGQASASLTLTQHNVLVIQSVSQAQTLDAVTLGVGLVSASVDQGQATASLTLTQHNVLVIQSVSQAQTLDAVLLGVGLLLAGTDQGQATASLTLIQHHHLTIQSGAQAQATEGLQLGVIGQLGIQSVSQGQGTDAPLLGISLIIQSASQAQTTDAVTYSTWRVNLTVLSNTPTPTLGLRRQPSSSPLVLSNTDGTMLSITRRLTLTQTATSQTASLPLGIIRRLLTTMLGVSLTSTPALIGYRLLTANGEVTVITSDSDAPVIDRQLTSNGLTVSLTPLITLIVTGRTWAQGRVRIRFRTR